MATRFRRLRTRRVKRRQALKTRKQRGGITLFGKEISLPFGKKKNAPPLTSSGTKPTGAPNGTFSSAANPLAKSEANRTMNKIQAELNRIKKEEANRKTSTVSDPGSVKL